MRPIYAGYYKLFPIFVRTVYLFKCNCYLNLENFDKNFSQFFVFLLICNDCIQSPEKLSTSRVDISSRTLGHKG